MLAEAVIEARISDSIIFSIEYIFVLHELRLKFCTDRLLISSVLLLITCLLNIIKLTFEWAHYGEMIKKQKILYLDLVILNYKHTKHTNFIT